MNDPVKSRDLRELFNGLFEVSVERGDSYALRNILDWFTEKIDTMEKMKGVIKDWNNQFTGKVLQI